jgi:hypothetical protein
MRFGSWIASGLFHFDYLTLARLDIATTVNYCELLSLTFLCGRKDRGRGFSKRGEFRRNPAHVAARRATQTRSATLPQLTPVIDEWNRDTRAVHPKKAARLVPARPFTLVSHHLVDAGK